MTEIEKPERDPLQQKVLEHIQKSGYPFEARIARAFSNCRVDEDLIDMHVSEYDTSPIHVVADLKPKILVRCGVPYFDAAEQKPRELDVHAVMSIKVMNLDLKINFIVQCKDTDKIWIFCHYGFETVPTILGKYYDHGIEFRYKDKPLDALKLILSPDPVLGTDPRTLCGAAKVMVKKNGDDKKDDIWEACITAIKATRYVRDVVKRTIKAEGQKELSLFVPMVATGNLIYHVDLSGETAEAKQVDVAYYSLQTIAEDGLMHEHYPIPIITEASLSQVVNSTVLNATRFLLGCFTW